MTTTIHPNQDAAIAAEIIPVLQKAGLDPNDYDLPAVADEVLKSHDPGPWASPSRPWSLDPEFQGHPEALAEVAQASRAEYPVERTTLTYPSKTEGTTEVVIQWRPLPLDDEECAAWEYAAPVRLIAASGPGGPLTLREVHVRTEDGPRGPVRVPITTPYLNHGEYQVLSAHRGDQKVIL